MSPFRSPGRLPGSAHILALVALFAALGGGAYAAIRLPHNSVGSAQIKAGAVTPAKLANRTKKLLAGKPGATGAPGSPGAAGAPGAPGAAGPSDVFAAGASHGVIPASYTTIASVTVPPGSYLIQAKVVAAQHTLGSAAFSDCIIGPAVALSPANWDEAEAPLPAVAATFVSQDLALLGVDTFTSQTDVILFCRTISGASDYDDARITAIRTGALHATVPLPID